MIRLKDEEGRTIEVKRVVSVGALAPGGPQRYVVRAHSPMLN